MIRLVILFTPLIAFTSAVDSTESGNVTLDLRQYLESVRESHLGFRAAELRSKSLKLESNVGSIALTPRLLASARYLDDSTPNSNTANFGDQTQTSSYSFGFSKLFSSGTETRALYRLDHTVVTAASPSFLPNPDYYHGSMNFEISQPLWRNFFGSETRALVQIAEAEKLEMSFNERFRMKQILTAAELTFWRMLAAQRVLKVRESSRDRAQKLSDWSEERVRLHLADRSDYLQAQAALKGREFELRNAVDELASASIAFNSMRGVESPEVIETLVRPNSEQLDRLEPPLRASLRDDTYAAQQRKRQAESSAQFSLEKGRPSLDLTGSLTLAARNSNASEATSESFSRDHPTLSIGIMLNAPLDFWKSKDLRDGALASQRAAEYDYQRKFFEQEREWADLNSQFQTKKDQLLLVRELEKVQNEKLVLEQERLKKGRTTTFQVLVFEQDFAAAKLNLILTETQLLTLRAQMKAFGDGPVNSGGNL